MSSELLKLVFQNTITATAVLTAAFAFVFFKEYLRFRIRTQQITKGIKLDDGGADEITKEADNDVLGPSNQRLDDPKHVVNSNFQLLERYYDQTLVGTV